MLEMIRCPFCITNWVDRAAGLAGVKLGDLERRRLIAGLLSRRHLILSGPPGMGKRQLARALALAGVEGQRDRICWLQGHPWWAANTSNVGRFVELQTDFSLWRLAQFADSALNARPENWLPLAHRSLSHMGLPKEPGQAVGQGTGLCSHIVCVERMSPVEIELYFRVVAKWLVQHERGESGLLPIRLVGTYDSRAPAMLDKHSSRLVALVHLDVPDERGARSQRRANDLRETLLATGH